MKIRGPVRPQLLRLALHDRRDRAAGPALKDLLVQHAVFVEEAVVAALY